MVGMWQVYQHTEMLMIIVVKKQRMIDRYKKSWFRGGKEKEVKD